ncbi:hypothetical protein TX25_06055 [Pseudomonas lactis]|uniref:hypothetical protein n=1 Tax=Pseudomonas lactis TaxID=1615674 RepID=UPI000714567C|nr:hypothetical protein [Pseudomonas lactis]KRP97466.1 hypothetical protein TX25_06055 [Pseudomonas lactis]
MRRIFSLFVLMVAVTAHAEPFKKASPEALDQATKQMGALDKAMLDGASILKSGDLATISGHSKHFSSLVKSGERQFGNTIFEPLGSCFAAGISSRSWWDGQLAAAHNGGIERVPGSIQDALSQFQERRKDCLQSADPLSSAKADEIDPELRKKLGGGRECLTVYAVDPETKEIVEKAKPQHCKT